MDVILDYARQVRTPRQMQRLLYGFKYNKGATMFSAATALRRREAHCMEAALAAAAVLEVHGYPPVIMSLESHDRLDHVVHVFRSHRTHGLYGAIGRSRDEGLHGRPAIFRTPRELAASYLDPYVDLTGRIRAFGLFHLDEQAFDWRRASRDCWPTEAYLLHAKHTPLDMTDARYARLHAAYKNRGPMPRQPFWW